MGEGTEGGPVARASARGRDASSIFVRMYVSRERCAHDEYIRELSLSLSLSLFLSLRRTITPVSRV